MSIEDRYSRFISKHYFSSVLNNNCDSLIHYLENIYQFLPAKVTMCYNIDFSPQETIDITKWTYYEGDNLYLSVNPTILCIIYTEGKCYHNITAYVLIGFEFDSKSNFYYPVHLEKTLYNVVEYNYLLFKIKHVNSNTEENEKNLYNYYKKIYKYLPAKITIFIESIYFKNDDDFIPLKYNKIEQKHDIGVRYYYPHINYDYYAYETFIIIFEYYEDKIYPTSFYRNFNI